MLKNTVRDLPTFVSYKEFDPKAVDPSGLMDWIGEWKNKTDFAKFYT
jgi:hypothetical protein